MNTPPHPTGRPSPLKAALRALALATCCGAIVSCCPAASTPCAAQACPPCVCQSPAEPATQPVARPGTQPAPAEAPQSSGSCHELVAQAVDDLDSVERTNKSCVTDGDCAVVDRNARCFDSCTTVISVAGISAYEQAKQRANQGPCAEFARQGCTPNAPPPCSPPGRPRCVAGSCGWYLPKG